jgi:hypothetical protein
VQRATSEYQNLCVTWDARAPTELWKLPNEDNVNFAQRTREVEEGSGPGEKWRRKEAEKEGSGGEKRTRREVDDHDNHFTKASGYLGDSDVTIMDDMSPSRITRKLAGIWVIAM